MVKDKIHFAKNEYCVIRNNGKVIIARGNFFPMLNWIKLILIKQNNTAITVYLLFKLSCFSFEVNSERAIMKILKYTNETCLSYKLSRDLSGPFLCKQNIKSQDNLQKAMVTLLSGLSNLSKSCKMISECIKIEQLSDLCHDG